MENEEVDLKDLDLRAILQCNYKHGLAVPGLVYSAYAQFKIEIYLSNLNCRTCP